MDYSLDSITTVAECDAVLSAVTARRGIQKYQLSALSKKRNISIAQGPNIDLEIAALTQNITAYRVLIAQLPEGPNKEAWESTLTKAEVDINALEKSRENYGLISRLEYEFTYNATEGYIAKLDDFIVLVNTRKAAL